MRVSLQGQGRDGWMRWLDEELNMLVVLNWGL